MRRDDGVSGTVPVELIHPTCVEHVFEFTRHDRHFPDPNPLSTREISKILTDARNDQPARADVSARRSIDDTLPDGARGTYESQRAIPGDAACGQRRFRRMSLSLIHISEPTRRTPISY